MRIALVVFARSPEPGRVKTRLIPALGAEGAARLYAGLLAQALDVARAAPVSTRTVYVDDATSLPWFAAQQGVRCRVQVQGDLGLRMHEACTDALADHAAVLLMGSDLVDVSALDVALAARWLGDDAEVVLGPVADGGYWLVGLRAPQPALFDGIAWGTGDVYTQTVARLAPRYR